jgi:hypothetical protein
MAVELPGRRLVPANDTFTSPSDPIEADTAPVEEVERGMLEPVGGPPLPVQAPTVTETVTQPESVTQADPVEDQRRKWDEELLKAGGGYAQYQVKKQAWDELEAAPPEDMPDALKKVYGDIEERKQEHAAKVSPEAVPEGFWGRQVKIPGAMTREEFEGRPRTMLDGLKQDLEKEKQLRLEEAQKEKPKDINAWVEPTPEAQRAWGESRVVKDKARLEHLDNLVSDAQAVIDNHQKTKPNTPVPAWMRERLRKAIVFRNQNREQVLKDIEYAKKVAAGIEKGPQLTYAENVINRFSQSVGGLFTGAARGYVFGLGTAGRALGADIDPLDNEMYRIADAAHEAVQEMFPGDPARQNEWGSAIASALGSGVGFYGSASAVNRVLGAFRSMSPKARRLWTMAATSTLGGFASGDEGVQDAIRSIKLGRSLTYRDLTYAYMLSTLGGTLEAAPIMAWLRTKQGGNIVADAFEQAMQEGGQEAVQGLWNDTVAKILHDPERNLAENVPSNFFGGFVAGGAMSPLGRLARVPKQPTPPPEGEGAAAPGGAAPGAAEAAAPAPEAPAEPEVAPEDPDIAAADREIKDALDRAEAETLPDDEAPPVQEIPEAPEDPGDIIQAAEMVDAIAEEFGVEPEQVVEAAAQEYDAEAIESMVNFVQEAEQLPKPKTLSQFLVELGGLQDEGGDVRSIMGNTRGRPGLVSGRGLALDEAAQRAWDAGYLPGLDRPDINQLKVALQEDLGTAPRYSELDSDVVEDLRIAEEMRQDLEGLGIPTRDADPVVVRERLAELRQEQADAAAEAETTPEAEMAPEPSLNDVRERFNDIIDGKMRSSKWADELGITPDQLQELIDEQVEAGRLVRRKDGVVARTGKARGSVSAAIRAEPIILDEAISERIGSLPLRAQRDHLRTLHEASLDSLAFESALGALEEDKTLRAREVVQIAKAYIGRLPWRPFSQRRTAIRAMRQEQRRRVNAVRMAQPNNRDIELVGANLQPIADFWNAVPQIAEMAERLGIAQDAISFQEILVMADGTPARGAAAATGLVESDFSPESVGAARHIIALAIQNNADAVMSAFTHETIHILRERGIIDDASWGVLTSVANKKPSKEVAMRIIKRMKAEDVGAARIENIEARAGKATFRELYGIDELYTDGARKAIVDFNEQQKKGWSEATINRLVEEKLLEEVVAHYAEDWNAGTLTATERVDGILGRIRDFMEMLRDLLGMNGFDAVDQTFNSVFSGELSRAFQARENRVMRKQTEWNETRQVMAAIQGIDDLVVQLNESFGKDDGVFEGLFETIKGMSADEVKQIAKQFVGAYGAPRSKTDALKKIWARHANILRADLHTRAVGNRIAGAISAGRKTLSIPGLKDIVDKRIEEQNRNMKRSDPVHSGVFRPREPLTWAGLPDVEFYADVVHIAAKRQKKNSETPQPETPEAVAEHIQEVLDGGTFRFEHQPDTGNVSLNLIKTGPRYDMVVAIRMDQMHGRMKINTVFTQTKARTSRQLIQSVDRNGLAAVKWKTGRYSRDEILQRVVQAPPDSRGPSRSLLKRAVLISQEQEAERMGPSMAIAAGPQQPLGFRLTVRDLAAKMTKRGTVQQMMKELTNKGVKKGEMEMLGLIDLFHAKEAFDDGTVTRQEILDTIDANTPILDEQFFAGMVEGGEVMEEQLESARDAEVESTVSEYEVDYDEEADAWFPTLYGDQVTEEGFDNEWDAWNYVEEMVRESVSFMSDEELMARHGIEALPENVEGSEGEPQYIEHSFGKLSGNYRETAIYMNYGEKHQELVTEMQEISNLIDSHREDLKALDPEDAAARSKIEGFIEDLKKEYTALFVEKGKLEMFTDGHFGPANTIGHLQTSEVELMPGDFAKALNVDIGEVTDKIIKMLNDRDTPNARRIADNPSSWASGLFDQAVEGGYITETERLVYEMMSPGYTPTDEQMAFLVDQIQSDWGQKYRDRLRDRATSNLVTSFYEKMAAKLNSKLEAIIESGGTSDDPVYQDIYDTLNQIEKISHEIDYKSFTPNMFRDIESDLKIMRLVMAENIEEYNDYVDKVREIQDEVGGGFVLTQAFYGFAEYGSIAEAEKATARIVEAGGSRDTNRALLRNMEAVGDKAKVFEPIFLMRKDMVKRVRKEVERMRKTGEAQELVDMKKYDALEEKYQQHAEAIVAMVNEHGRGMVQDALTAWKKFDFAPDPIAAAEAEVRDIEKVVKELSWAAKEADRLSAKREEADQAAFKISRELGTVDDPRYVAAREMAIELGNQLREATYKARELYLYEENLRQANLELSAMKEVPRRIKVLDEEMQSTKKAMDELNQFEITYHPLIADTETWARLLLRRVLGMAVDQNRRVVAIPKGETVVAYNPGKQDYFYNEIVPKVFKKLLKSFDPKTPDPIEVKRVRTKGGKFAGNGFNLFQITDEARRKAREEGIGPMLAISSRTKKKGFADPGLRADGDHVDRISTRFPQQQQSTEDPIIERLQITEEQLALSPDVYQFNADLVRTYPWWPKSKRFRKPEKVFEHMREFIVDNLLWIYDQTPESRREVTRQWYVGANRIAQGWAMDYGLPLRVTAGLLAGYSPQTAWQVNVGRAERTLDIFHNRMDYPWDKQMETTAKRILENKPELHKAIKKKTLRQLIDKDTNGKYVEAAAWLRVYDETHNPRKGRDVHPLGYFVPGGKNNEGFTCAWCGFDNIGRMISILVDPSYANISRKMGGGHKVRSFYNNILAPHAPHGDVTIDTHATAVGYVMPIAASDRYAQHAMGLGTEKGVQKMQDHGKHGGRGIYGPWGDAYREAARQRGTLPREMQSVTWEGGKGLFDEDWKKTNKQVVDDVWKEYAAGKITADEARSRIYTLAGGIDPPSWELPNGGVHARKWDSSYEGELPEARLKRRGRMGTGARGAASSRASAKSRRLSPAIAAKHGSPHRFRSFSLQKIGTGEGGAAFGWGLYFAEEQQVAESYANIKPTALVVGGARYDLSMADQYRYDKAVREGANDTQKALAAIYPDLLFFRGREDVQIDDLLEGHADRLDDRGEPVAAEILRSWIGRAEVDQGYVYDVTLDVEPEDLLDWDVPFSGQSYKVQQILRDVLSLSPGAQEYWRGALIDDLNENGPMGYDQARLERAIDEALVYGEYGPEFGTNVFDEIIEASPNLGAEFQDVVARAGIGMDPDTDTGQQIYNTLVGGLSNDMAASQKLLELGIPGLRFYDRGSRDAQEGTRNYVIFDDSLISINTRNGEPVNENDVRMIMAALSGKEDPRQLQLNFDAALDPDALKEAHRQRNFNVDRVAWRHPASVQDAAEKLDYMPDTPLLFGKASQFHDGEVGNLPDSTPVYIRNGALASEAQYREEFMKDSGGLAPSLVGEDERAVYQERAFRRLRARGFVGIETTYPWGDNYIVVLDEADIQPTNEPPPRMPTISAAFGSKPPQPNSIDAAIYNLKRALGIQVNQWMYGVTVRVGDRKTRLNPPKGRGYQYRPDIGSVGVKRSRDIKAIARAGGFALERQLGEPLAEIQREFAAELVPDGMQVPPGQSELSEAFSRFFERYIVDREGARQMAPDFFEAFEEVVDAEVPGMLPQLDAATEAYKAWSKAATPREFAADIVSSENRRTSWWRRIMDPDKSLRQNIAGWAVTGWHSGVDLAHPTRILQRKFLHLANRNGVLDENGRPISLKVSENAYKLQRLFPGAHQQGYTWITEGVTDYHGDTPKHPPLTRAMELMAGGKGKKWTDEAKQALDSHLISTRAIAEYDLLETKRNTLTQLDKSITDNQSRYNQLRTQQTKDKNLLESRKRQLHRVEGQLKARERDLRQASRRDSDVYGRLEDARAALTAENAGRLAPRIQRLEREAQQSRRAREILEAEVFEISTDEAVRAADVARLEKRVNGRKEALVVAEEGLKALRKRRDEVRKRGASREPTLRSRQEHVDNLAKLEAEWPDIKEAADVVHQYLYGLLVFQRQAQFITQERFEYLASRSGWYVPFDRDMSGPGDPLRPVFGGASSKFWKPFKKYDGSDRPILSPMETIAEESYRIAQATAMNDIVEQFASLAERAGPGSAEIAQVMDMRSEDPEAIDKLEEYAVQHGIDPEDARRLAQSMETDFLNGDLEVLWSPSFRGPDTPPTLPLYRDGKRIFVAITDPEWGQAMVESFKGMGREPKSLIFDTIFGRTARGIQIGVTTHPNFMPRNLWRDSLEAFRAEGALPIVTQIEGFYKMARDPEFMRMYMAAGGITGGRNLAALTQKEKQYAIMDLDPQVIKPTSVLMGAGVGAMLGGAAGFMFGAAPLGAMIGSAGFAYLTKSGQLLRAIEGVETATRIGVAAKAYRRVVKNGGASGQKLTPVEAMTEAAWISRNTFDWNRHGSKMYAVLRNVTFLSAQINGMARYMEGMMGTGDRNASNIAADISRRINIVLRREQGLPLSHEEQYEAARGYKEVMRWTLLNMAFISAILAIRSASDDEDDWEYDDLEERAKARGLWIMNIWGDHDLELPKIFESTYPSHLVEIMHDHYARGDERFWSRILSATYETMLPPVVPGAVTLFGGYLYGQKLDGIQAQRRDIESRWDRGQAPELKYNARTSMLARDLSNAMVSSGVPEAYIPTPYQIDFTFHTFAYWGRQATDSYDMMRQSVTGEVGKAPDVPQWPVIGAMVKNSDRQSRAVRQFYDFMASETGLYRTTADDFKKALDGKGDEAAGYRVLLRRPKEVRAYALTQYYGNTEDRRAHPLNRLAAINGVIHGFGSDINGNSLTMIKSGRKLADFEEKLELDAKTKTAMLRLTEKLRRMEAWNTMSYLNVDGFKNRSERDTREILDTMRDLSPEAFEVFEARLAKAKVREWDYVKNTWPSVQDRMLQEYPSVFK